MWNLHIPSSLPVCFLTQYIYMLILQKHFFKQFVNQNYIVVFYFLLAIFPCIFLITMLCTPFPRKQAQSIISIHCL